VAGAYRSDNHHPRAASGLSHVNGTPASARANGRRYQMPTRIARDLVNTSTAEARVAIDSDRAIVEARRQARRLANAAGLKPTDMSIVTTVVSELARNTLLFAHGGRQGERQGVVVIATDDGPGIPDVTRAMQDGYSTVGRLGLGLPGAKRLMDEFEIASAAGAGTTVIARKWAR